MTSANESLFIHYLLSVVFIHSTLVFGDDSFFPVGRYSQTVGFGSAAGNSAQEAVLYNPATLILLTHPLEPRGERATELNESLNAWRQDVTLSWVSIRQSYEHPDYDPVVIKIRTPHVSLGASKQISNFAFGLAFNPRNYGKQKINGLPRRILDGYQSLDVKFYAKVYELGVGGAAQFFQKSLSVGFGLVMLHDETVVEAKVVGSDSILGMSNISGTFFIPRFGINTQTSAGDVALSYSFEKLKKYSGTEKSAFDDEASSAKTRKFEPRTFRLCYTTPSFSGVNLSLHTQYQLYSEGRKKVREALSSNSNQSDLKDVLDLGILTSWNINPTHQVTASYSILPAALGDGLYNEENPEGETYGRDFSSPRSLDRTHWGFAYENKSLQNFELSSSLSYWFGRHETSSTAYTEGFFQSELLVLGFEGRYVF